MRDATLKENKGRCILGTICTILSMTVETCGKLIFLICSKFVEIMFVGRNQIAIAWISLEKDHNLYIQCKQHVSKIQSNKFMF